MLDLPQEKALELNELIRQISNVRWEYDEIKLSSENRVNLTKIEIKMLIAERDLAIKELIERDSQLYQLWRLTNLNSMVLDPEVKRKYDLKARNHAPTVYFNIYGCAPDKKSKDDMFNLKRIQVKLKKEAVRASLNKKFSEEAEIFRNDPENYVAPNFV